LDGKKKERGMPGLRLAPRDPGRTEKSGTCRSRIVGGVGVVIGAGDVDDDAPGFVGGGLELGLLASR